MLLLLEKGTRKGDWVYIEPNNTNLLKAGDVVTYFGYHPNDITSKKASNPYGFIVSGYEGYRVKEMFDNISGVVIQHGVPVSCWRKVKEYTPSWWAEPVPLP